MSKLPLLSTIQLSSVDNCGKKAFVCNSHQAFEMTSIKRCLMMLDWISNIHQSFKSCHSVMLVWSFTSGDEEKISVTKEIKTLRHRQLDKCPLTLDVSGKQPIRIALLLLCMRTNPLAPRFLFHPVLFQLTICYINAELIVENGID